MERLRLSPRAYSRITLVALAALACIVVTGGAVRLTGSGLGCPDWPTCAAGRVVAPLEYHAMVEFVNRLVTGAVSVLVIVAVLGSLVRTPRRRDLTWLSLGLVAGVIGQIVLGGLVGLFHLAPPLVMGHFVLSMLLLADATVLHHRAGQPDGPVRAAAGPETVQMGRLLVAFASVAILLGTVVTGAGPHAGSHEGQLVERLPFAVSDVATIEPDVEEQTRVEIDRPWIVIVWNDPINLMSYVTFVFQKLFGYSKEKATKLMLDVHEKGRAVVAAGGREKCEMDVFRLHEHGLWATMEHQD
jgi:heme A synthase